MFFDVNWKSTLPTANGPVSLQFRSHILESHLVILPLGNTMNIPSRSVVHFLVPTKTPTCPVRQKRRLSYRLAPLNAVGGWCSKLGWIHIYIYTIWWMPLCSDGGVNDVKSWQLQWQNSRGLSYFHLFSHISRDHLSLHSYASGWWFGTFFIFPYIGNSSTNWPTFFRGVGQPPTRYVVFHIFPVPFQNKSHCKLQVNMAAKRWNTVRMFSGFLREHSAFNGSEAKMGATLW